MRRCRGGQAYECGLCRVSRLGFDAAWGICVTALQNHWLFDEEREAPWRSPERFAGDDLSNDHSAVIAVLLF